MRVLFGVIFLVFLTTKTFCQPELFMIYGDMDSLEYSRSFEEMDSSSQSLLLRIKDNKATYTDFLTLLKEHKDKSNLQKNVLIDFVNSRIRQPTSPDLDIDYVNLKTLIISILRDEILEIQTSTGPPEPSISRIV